MPRGIICIAPGCPGNKEKRIDNYHSILSADAGATMRPYPLAPLSVGSAGKIEDMGVGQVGKKKFPELGLPGVEILNGACRSILHLSRGSQSPYSEKSKKSENLPKTYSKI